MVKLLSVGDVLHVLQGIMRYKMGIFCINPDYAQASRSLSHMLLSPFILILNCLFSNPDQRKRLYTSVKR